LLWENPQRLFRKADGEVKIALPQESDEQTVARAIFDYLQAHPDAADTLEGIAQWWLLRECTERRLVEVEHAISILLAEGSIVQISRAGRPLYFKLNKQPEQEAANRYRDSKSTSET